MTRFIRRSAPSVDDSAFRLQRLKQRATNEKECENVYLGLSVLFAPAMNNWAHQLFRDGCVAFTLTSIIRTGMSAIV